MKLNSESKQLLGIGSAMFALFSALGMGGIDLIFDSVTGSMAVLKNGSSTFKAWQEMPIPIYLKFRFFNITNPDEFAKGSKANLKEMGPYTYMEDWKKVDVSIDTENDTIQYRMTKTYFFMPNMSEGTEEDSVTFINLIFISTISLATELVQDDYIIGQMDKLLRSKGERLTMTGTVRQILFDGVPVKAYTEIFNTPAVQELAGEMGIQIPDNLKNGKFALLKSKNGTDDGWFVIKSGLKNSAEAGSVVSYNRQEELHYWSNASCNKIHGSDGTHFPPHITKKTVLQIFAPGICRSLSLTYHDEGTTHGLHTYRFVWAKENWMSPKSNPDNSCYCPEGKLETCDKDGVFNIAPCADGAPLLLSQPHFYGADEWIQDSVIGMEPEFDKHMTIIHFHPMTGNAIETKGRLQFSIELKPNPVMPSFAHVKHAVVPFAWIEENSSLKGHELQNLITIDILHSLLKIIPFPLIAVGGYLFFRGMVMAKNSRQHQSPVRPFIVDNTEEVI